LSRPGAPAYGPLKAWGARPGRKLAASIGHVHIALGWACHIAICGAFNGPHQSPQSGTWATPWRGPRTALLASPFPLDVPACWLDIRVDGRVLPCDLHTSGVAVAWPDRAAQKSACPAATD
jgi:hypothetical protein